MKCFQVLLSALLILFSGCETKPIAQGELDEIYVFADSLDWLDYRDALSSYFAREYLTPVPEPEYLLKWRPFSNFSEYKHKTNLMLLARLDGQDAVSREITSLLNEEIITGVNNGDYFYIPQENTWARGQYVVYLVAPSKDALIQRCYDLGELVYDDFEKSYYTRLRKEMYKHGENKKLSKYISNNFPFTLKVQPDYMLVDESLDERYIWLRRVYIDRDRSLAVHWIPNADSVEITREWLIARRNALAAKIYSGDRVVEPETIFEPAVFNQWQGYRLEGTWMNPKLYVGGPFRTIAFKDPQTHMIVLIDFYVQAIGERKKPYLDQLEVIAHSFQLEARADKAAMQILP